MFSFCNENVLPFLRNICSVNVLLNICHISHISVTRIKQNKLSTSTFSHKTSFVFLKKL